MGLRYGLRRRKLLLELLSPIMTKPGRDLAFEILGIDLQRIAPGKSEELLKGLKLVMSMRPHPAKKKHHIFYFVSPLVKTHYTFRFCKLLSVCISYSISTNKIFRKNYINYKSKKHTTKSRIPLYNNLRKYLTIVPTATFYHSNS